MKKKRRKDYTPTTNDSKIMSICIKAGYKVYTKIPKYRKHWPLVYLVYSQFGREMKPKSTETFEQCYLSYEIHRWYNYLYKIKVVPMLNKPKRKKRQVMLPPLPPPPPKKVPLPPPN